MRGSARVSRLSRSRPLRTVAIVGGGFSGTALAATLLARGEAPIRVLLFDRTGVFGAGVAYATDEPCHLLNVPASKMSAFEDRPNHFADWLSERRIDAGDGFVARRHYRHYLTSLLELPPRNSEAKLRTIGEEIVSVGEGFRLSSATGSIYTADDVVLATGYLPETAFGGDGALRPFAPETWPTTGVRHAVVIGSGLTALDACASVFARYPGTRVVCVSRHGLFPEAFDLHAPPHSLAGPPPMGSVRATLRWLRLEIASAEAQGAGWASVFDALRPQWETLWQALPDRERDRFVSHLVRYFDRFRHRVPPTLYTLLAPRWTSGELSSRRGRIVEIGDAVRLADGAVLPADLVLDASGFSWNWAGTRDQLARRLLESGLVRIGPLGMGIVPACDRLHAVGPPLRGSRWETTAVPEIRRQIAAVCEAILAECAPRNPAGATLRR